MAKVAARRTLLTGGALAVAKLVGSRPSHVRSVRGTGPADIARCRTGHARRLRTGHARPAQRRPGLAVHHPRLRRPPPARAGPRLMNPFPV